MRSAVVDGVVPARPTRRLDTRDWANIRQATRILQAEAGLYSVEYLGMRFVKQFESRAVLPMRSNPHEARSQPPAQAAANSRQRRSAQRKQDFLKAKKAAAVDKGPIHLAELAAMPAPHSDDEMQEGEVLSLDGGSSAVDLSDEWRSGLSLIAAHAQGA